jgi:hypothetical protein
MNKEKIRLSENILKIFDENILGKEVFYEGENYICYSGIPVQGFNFAYIISGTLNDIKKIIEKSEKIFKERKQSFNIVLSDSFFELSKNLTKKEEVHNFFIQNGYKLTSRDPRMILENYEPKEFNLKEGIEIFETSFDLKNWIAPLKTSFSSTSKVCDLYKESHAKATIKNGQNFKHYTLFLEKNPISSVTFTIDKSVAQVDDMGTDIEFQKKGYGSVLLNFCLNEISKNFGIKTFFLNSSEEGYTLYKKFFFNDFYFLNVYSK